MKTEKSKGIKILAASTALALAGIMLTATANAGRECRSGNTSVYRTVRTLDVLTDRMHTMAKRELRHYRDGRRTIALICDLESRADRLRSGVENRLHVSGINRLVRSVEECAFSVASRLRRAHVSCELNEIAAATLERARSLSDRFVDRRRDYDRTQRGHRHARSDRSYSQTHDHRYDRYNDRPVVAYRSYHFRR